MKFSILTPSFNSEKYIRRAIESVLRQDYENWEHIIIDGNSSDGTIEILKKFPHLIWESKSDKGQSDAMNKALARASGEIIIFLNADDELSAGLLTQVAAQFKAFPSTDLLVGNVAINNRGSISIRKPSISLKTILHYWPCRFPLNPASYAYKREIHYKIGYYPLDNHYAMDYWFLLRAYLFGKVRQFDFVCGTYYIDGSNKSSDISRSKSALRRVRNDFLKEFFYKKKVFFFILGILPSYFLKQIRFR